MEGPRGKNLQLKKKKHAHTHTQTHTRTCPRVSVLRGLRLFFQPAPSVPSTPDLPRSFEARGRPDLRPALDGRLRPLFGEREQLAGHTRSAGRSCLCSPFFFFSRDPRDPNWWTSATTFEAVPSIKKIHSQPGLNCLMAGALGAAYFSFAVSSPASLRRCRSLLHSCEQKQNLRTPSES